MDSLVTIPTSMLFNIQELHIELSSKCTLKCPRCPRTELDFDHLNQEYSLEQFQTAFDPAILQHVKFILLCGDIGDPIYAKDFLKIIKYIKNNSQAYIRIVTNGSYKSADWWQELGQLLTVTDTVVFSVDGWDNESNNIYRINSNWDSIITGITSLRKSSNCIIVWSTIYFKFNENRINQIKDQAQAIGCDEWQVVASSKFDGRYLVDGVDSLKPDNEENISKNSQYSRHHVIFNRPRAVPDINRVKKHSWARCLNSQKELFIGVNGVVLPCPWFNSGYIKNHFVEKYQDNLNVKLRSLSEVLQDPVWTEFVETLDSSPIPICRIKCRDCK